MIEPIAFLIFSNLPGQNKLKNIKFFMGVGDNIIGTDSRCQIILPEKYDMPSYMGNIRIGYNFITIESFHPYLFYVQANLHRHSKEKQVDNFFPIQVNFQYVPKIGEFFYIGRIKCLIDTATLEQFRYMKNIENARLFKLQSNSQISQQFHNSPKKQDYKNNQTIFLQKKPLAIAVNRLANQKDDIKQKQQTKKRIIKDVINQIQQQFFGDEDKKVEEDIKSHTQLLDQQNYQIQATLLLEDGREDFQPTINLQEQIAFQKINQPLQNHKHYSQQHLLNEIRKQYQASNSQHPNIPQQQEQFSMPDTIVDKVQPQAKNQHMFQLIESKSQNPDPNQQLNDEEMPATIKQDENQSISNNRMAQTGFVQKKKNQERLYKSDFIGKQSNISQPSKNHEEIQDFEDLFGDKEIMVVSALKHHHSNELKNHEKQFALKQMHSLKQAPVQKQQLILPNSQKLQVQNKFQSVSQLKKEDNLVKKVHLTGFKPTYTHRQHLKKHNLLIASNSDEDYDILIVKQPMKISNHLLLALINKKMIESQQWIFNKGTQITSKINNMPWKSIYDKRGTQAQLLKGKGLFYISKRLQQLFQKVIESMGGKLVKELVDKKKVINIILRVQDSVDTQLYLKHRQNKKWRFLKSEIIIDAILLGKYSLQQKYIIDIFQDQ